MSLAEIWVYGWGFSVCMFFATIINVGCAYFFWNDKNVFVGFLLGLLDLVMLSPAIHWVIIKSFIAKWFDLESNFSDWLKLFCKLFRGLVFYLICHVLAYNIFLFVVIRAFSSIACYGKLTQMNDATEEMFNGILHTCVMLAFEVELKQISFATIPICLASSALVC
jgi:hypothetical protein